MPIPEFIKKGTFTCPFFKSVKPILGVHRKVFPSNREKLYHACGNGSTLKLHDTPAGRIGGLICFEHLQPQLKYACIAQGEQIHWLHGLDGPTSKMADPTNK